MKIAIYGAGEVGKKVYHSLLSSGASPQAFFDRKARKGDKLLGIPMLSVNDYLSLDYSDTIVIIALSDGLAHKEVADKLYARGFRKIVFLPVAYDMPTTLKRELTILYNEYLEGRVTGVVHDYAYYAESSFLDAGQAVASAGIDKVVAWVPLELVFTESLEHWPGDKNLLKSPYAYYDRNIATNYWLVNLIDYLQGETDSCDTYLSMYERNGGGKPSIDERKRQFDLFEHEYSFGMDFFVQSAPDAMWNERGYFNIVGGNHRIMYLYAKGCRYFPLRISRQDFIRWQGMGIATPEVAAHISYPVSHPAFQHIVVPGTSHIYREFKSVEERYGHEDMSNKKILDLSHTEGFFGRQFARMKGTRVAIAATADELGYYEQLNELCVSEAEIVDESTLSESAMKYDIILHMDEQGRLKIKEQEANHIG